ncbi:hypothetical protein [Schlesneria paludicola]|uniref:hypothetical protein n=1 Tax=Schlesneria paludicola TaxID=360056 RepID=UPI00029AC864|nr:hypothetical protein [Schlesneria paludicola]
MNALQFSDRITCLPIIHGSGDFALEVRRLMLSVDFDCLAVPLPPSFQSQVERAIAFLPNISFVLQEETPAVEYREWSGFDSEESDDDPPRGPGRTASYVPIDPCQGVIAGLRFAIDERMTREFVDLETACFESYSAVLPDPYALKRVRPEKFAAAVLPTIPRVNDGQPNDRVVHMARRLRELERKHHNILFLCSLLDWPWIREAYTEERRTEATDDEVEPASIVAADPDTLLFGLGEMPYITGLYELARAELGEDENLSIDGVKAMLLAARDRYQSDLGKRARKITPKLLRLYLQYVRNLTLIERRLTPALYTLIIAAKQVVGDQFAIALANVAREYPYHERIPFPTIKLGITRGRLPEGDMVDLKNRLPGQAVEWRTCKLKPHPPKPQQDDWLMRWNPHRQCSWPPEDIAIEKFRTHVKDAALNSLGTDLARSEKFTTSMKDGLDIRETLRNWHTGNLYVKVLPPTRGTLDCVVMMFDSPADPRDYPWRVTWHAEHHDESTLALFATNYLENLVGPGIGQATYGGAVFLFPPRPVSDIWSNPRFDFTDTLEERLLAAACYYARERHVALLSHAPPGPVWRQLAKRFGKKLVHVPLSKFSQETIEQLRVFHVLNGQQVRSFAAQFIRKV